MIRLSRLCLPTQETRSISLLILPVQLSPIQTGPVPIIELSPIPTQHLLSLLASAEWIGSWGPIKSDPQSVEGLSVGSNNTGELRAIIELFDYLLYYAPISNGDTVVIHTDSQYVLSLLQGSSLPATRRIGATVLYSLSYTI